MVISDAENGQPGSGFSGADDLKTSMKRQRRAEGLGEVHDHDAGKEGNDKARRVDASRSTVPFRRPSRSKALPTRRSLRLSSRSQTLHAKTDTEVLQRVPLRDMQDSRTPPPSLSVSLPSFATDIPSTIASTSGQKACEKGTVLSPSPLDGMTLPTSPSLELPANPQAPTASIHSPLSTRCPSNELDHFVAKCDEAGVVPVVIPKSPNPPQEDEPAANPPIPFPSPFFTDDTPLNITGRYPSPAISEDSQEVIFILTNFSDDIEDTDSETQAQPNLGVAISLG
ncbi:hypothetical protein GYMLUDRAFT_244637 [Collybiopsis luxurians FD-317 M1]|uniref:Uncharacterized protein n=1 Tax=Collybiopsis luxurians FD-317 M1 TaxID=944289 RepID=A0A0D0BX17_9AGAR|nr:hypothetical protein GYMLUDRAFT_244637 [Collybiopsis luxurians FD-317 M1]